MIRIKGYNHAPRVCVVCEKTYTPTGPTQKYCLECKKIVRKGYWRAAKEKLRRGPYLEAQHISNTIIRETDFLNLVRERIRSQKGDTISVKKIVKYVVKNMGITSISTGALKVCYRATEGIIVDEFAGEIRGYSDYGGLVFQLPKERKT